MAVHLTVDIIGVAGGVAPLGSDSKVPAENLPAGGSTGPQGLMGVPGLDGEDGLDGWPGTSGRNGVDGVAGDPGIPGSPGATGSQGIMGIPGIDGEDGEDAWPIPGKDGSQGTAGTPGTPGATGQSGLMGIPGQDGEDGGDNWPTPSTHGHKASDVMDRTPSNKFLRDDGTWAAPTAEATINIKQTEIDFGSTPVAEASFIITDASVLVTSQLIGNVAYEAPTDKDLDELEMDGLDLKFAPGSGQFTLYARGLDGYIADKFKINYLVG